MGIGFERFQFEERTRDKEKEETVNHGLTTRLRFFTIWDGEPDRGACAYLIDQQSTWCYTTRPESPHLLRADEGRKLTKA